VIAKHGDDAVYHGLPSASMISSWILLTSRMANLSESLRRYVMSSVCEPAVSMFNTGRSSLCFDGESFDLPRHTL